MGFHQDKHSTYLRVRLTLLFDRKLDKLVVRIQDLDLLHNMLQRAAIKVNVFAIIKDFTLPANVHDGVVANHPVGIWGRWGRGSDAVRHAIRHAKGAHGGCQKNEKD